MREPKANAAIMGRLAATLFPGDDDFPDGATTGLQAKLIDRLLDTAGESGLDAVLDALDGLDAASPEGCVDIVSRFEREQPKLFDHVRTIAFLAYYEDPFVQAVIRKLGYTYNATPLPKGYGVKRFDFEKDTPRHGRGRFIPTDQVKPIDISKLNLAEARHG